MPLASHSSKCLRRRLFVSSCLILAVCVLPGCKRKKLHARPDFGVPKKTARSEMSAIPPYNRYYALWRIAHSNLEITIRNKWDRSDVDYSFDQAIQNLKLMNKFLDDEKKAKVKKFTSEYTNLRETANLGQPSRRTISRLARLKVQIKKSLSPKDEPK